VTAAQDKAAPPSLGRAAAPRLCSRWKEVLAQHYPDALPEARGDDGLSNVVQQRSRQQLWIMITFCFQRSAEIDAVMLLGARHAEKEG
jgi:hypothetical protein